MKKKTLALLAALVLVVGCVIGGTLAWLTAESDEMVNTFTNSDINITLTETTGENYKMVPGCTIQKDPKVTVTKGSEECYLFVKLEKSGNFDDFLTYKMADDWTKLTDVGDVYYRDVRENGIDTPYSVLKDDQVSVKDDVTKEMMNGLTKESYPKLTVTAYASQLYKNGDEEFTAIEAWENAKNAQQAAQP